MRSEHGLPLFLRHCHSVSVQAVLRPMFSRPVEFRKYFGADRQLYPGLLGGGEDMHVRAEIASGSSSVPTRTKRMASPPPP